MIVKISSRSSKVNKLEKISIALINIQIKIFKSAGCGAFQHSYLALWWSSFSFHIQHGENDWETLGQGGLDYDL